MEQNDQQNLQNQERQNNKMMGNLLFAFLGVLFLAGGLCSIFLLGGFAGCFIGSLFITVGAAIPLAKIINDCCGPKKENEQRASDIEEDKKEGKVVIERKNELKLEEKELNESSKSSENESSKKNENSIENNNINNGEVNKNNLEVTNTNIAAIGNNK